MFRTVPFTRTMSATLIYLSINLLKERTSQSTLIRLFEWNLEKMIRNSQKRKEPISSPFSLVHHTTTFVMATRQMKTARSSRPKEKGGAVSTISSVDSQICATRDSPLIRSCRALNECVQNNFIDLRTSWAALTDGTFVPAEFIPNQQRSLGALPGQVRDLWKLSIGPVWKLSISLDSKVQEHFYLNCCN